MTTATHVISEGSGDLAAQKQRRRWSHVAIVSLLLLAGWLVYHSALGIGYLSDDYDWMVLAARAGAGSNESARFAATQAVLGGGAFWRPLITASFRLERGLGANAVFSHHLLNLYIHLLAAITVYALSLTLSQRRWLAAAGAFLFLLHPLAVPSVFWLASRVDSLMALGYLLALLAFVRYLRRGNRGPLLISWLAFAAALLSKEMAATLPVALLLLWLLLGVMGWGQKDQREERRRVPVALGGHLLLTLTYLAYATLRLQGAEGPTPFTWPGGRALLEAGLGSLLSFVWPNQEYAAIALYNEHPWLLPLGVGLTLATTLLLLAWQLRRGTRHGLLTLLLTTALLGTGLAPLLLTSSEGRRLYLPLAIVAVAPSLLVRAYPRLLRPLTFVLIAATLLFLPQTLQQGGAWATNWQVTQGYCRDFRGIVDADEEEPRLLLLAVPDRAANVPLYTRGVNGALYHCLYGEFGTFSRLLALGRVMRAETPPQAGNIMLTYRAPGEWRLAVAGAGAYFHFGREVTVGTLYAGPYLTVVVEDVRQRYRVTAFSVAIAATALRDDIHVLFFDGSRLHALPME